MEELIFFAVIIFFSVLESIARSRKAKKRKEADVDSPLPDPREWETRSPDLDPPGREGSLGGPPGDDPPSYDDDPSYDEVATRKRQEREDRTLDRYQTPRGTDDPVRPTPVDRRPSSETMLPGDLLEQLESLARGRQPERQKGSRPVEPPRRSPPSPTPIERSEVGTGRGVSGPVGSTAPVGSRDPIGAGSVEHAVHRSHAGYGTDPSSRAPSEQDGLDPLAERLDADAAAVRRMLYAGGRPALRQAMVLKEVLGPPQALRTGVESDR